MAWDGEIDDVGSALAYLAKHGYLQTCSLLLEQKTDLDIKRDLGTALGYASINGQKPTVQILLNAGAVPWSGSEIYCSVLEAAILNGSGDTEWEGCIQALLNVPQAIDRFGEIRYWPLIDAF